MGSPQDRRALLRPLLVLGLTALVLVAVAGCGRSAGSSHEQAPGGSAGQAGGPKLNVTGAWVRAAAQGDMSAAYFTVENRSTEAVRLTGVRADAAGKAELHESVQEGNTVRMQPVEAVEVPAGGRVEFAPGGYHVMLMDLKQELHPGDRVDLTLVFDGGQEELQVSAEVRDAAGGASGHSEGH